MGRWFKISNLWNIKIMTELKKNKNETEVEELLRLHESSVEWFEADMNGNLTKVVTTDEQTKTFLKSKGLK